MVSLRPWRETDVPAKLMAFGDPVVQRFSWSRTTPYTEADAGAYFVEQEQARRRGEALHFAVVEPANDDVVLGKQSSPQHGALSPLAHPRTQLYFVDGEWPTSVPAASTRRSSSPNPLHCRDYRHRSAVLATPRTILWPCRSSDAYDFADRWPTEP